MRSPEEPVTPAPVQDPERRPRLDLYLSDFPRAIGGFGVFFALAPLLRVAAPRGDGHPVLVLPGLMASDSSTLVLRRYLQALGYDVHGWKLGRNIGPTPEAVYGMGAKLQALVEHHERKVSVIGWSLGGIYARVLARLHPEGVRQVITLGSPYRMRNGDESRANRTYDRFSHLHIDGVIVPTSEEAAQPLAVPATSVYSKLDGIVPWNACREDPGPRRESIEIMGSHFGLGHNPAALWVVADRLALPEERWRPFSPPSLLKQFYRREKS
jgi:pimeloyl-ACP methyl ester carboxylesterase